ncbi:hypothetical protein IX51_09555 [uncultured archaeon]|nr:hypothetical protein IX51_09555 [uncultured archaeon]
MNRRLTLLLIAAVSAILPAVAVADVMITGQVGVNGTHNNAAFWLAPGSNFQTADGSISWNPYTGTHNAMGDLQFGTVSNQSTFIINVMQINFAPTLGSGMFYFNSTVSSPFVTGSYMYFSLAPLSFSDFNYQGLPGEIPTVVNPGVTAFSLTSADSYSVAVDGSTTIYIGFFTPPYDGAALNGEILVSMTYISS